MTDIHENIATLTGTLKFIADLDGLKKFAVMVKAVERCRNWAVSVPRGP